MVIARNEFDTPQKIYQTHTLNYDGENFVIALWKLQPSRMESSLEVTSSQKKRDN